MNHVLPSTTGVKLCCSRCFTKSYQAKKEDKQSTNKIQTLQLCFSLLFVKTTEHAFESCTNHLCRYGFIAPCGKVDGGPGPFSTLYTITEWTVVLFKKRHHAAICLAEQMLQVESGVLQSLWVPYRATCSGCGFSDSISRGRWIMLIANFIEKSTRPLRASFHTVPANLWEPGFVNAGTSE